MPILPILGAAGFAAAGLGATAIVLIALVLFLSIFWIWMMIDCLTSNLPPIEKLIWFLVIFFLHIVGAVLYYVIARSGGRRSAV